LCTLDRIPVTALISDDVDRALLALLVIVLGYLMLRFRLVDSLWLETSQRLNLPNFRTDKVKPKKEPKDFEDKFD